MIRARFFVAGEPATQGSKRIVQPKGHRRPMLIEMTSKKLKPWREAIEAEALVARQRYGTLAGPLRLDVTFWLKRPKKPTYLYPTADLDKLVRALGDGLQASGLLKNDRALTTFGSARKRWTLDDGRRGASVTLLDDDLGLA